VAVSTILLERSLLDHKLVWVGAGTESHMAALPPADLVRITNARTFDLTASG